MSNETVNCEAWITATEEALTSVFNQTNIPYDFETMDNDDKLPDNYIVYFLVSNPPVSVADNQIRTTSPKIQVSFYFRNKQEFLTVPKIIKDAFKTRNFTIGNEGRIPYQTTTGHYGRRYEFNFYGKGD